MSTRTAISLGLCAIAAVIGLMLYRCQRQSTNDYVAELAAEGAVVFAELAMVPLQDVDERFVEQMAREGAVVGHDLADEASKKRLLEFVLGFLDCYYDEDGGAERYIEWRRSLGDQLLEPDEFAPVHGMFYEHLGDGETVPPDSTGADVLEQIRQWSIRNHNRGNVPLKIASTQDGFNFRFKRLSADDARPPRWPDSYARLWAGGIVKSSVDFWEPKKSLQDALEQHESVLAGYFSAILEFKDGTRRPWTWVCFLDPDDGRWRFVVLLQNNIVGEKRYPPGL